ncbi:MAG: hypothetical protein J6K45_05190 [Clostridia bacterium]|nr:hypothetical protein [Clostridia bacterium]
MKYKLNLNDRAFDAIINKTKRIEIRTNTNNHNYDSLESNDIIEFTNSINRKIICKVKDVNHYDTVENLLILEGTKYTTSSTNDYQKAIERINSLNGYEEAIKKFGVYAIHIEYLYELTNIWDELYKKCKEILNNRIISDSVTAGGVAAAILTTRGNIYTGVCIDTACSLGCCAERNAIGNMITNGEHEIDMLVCIGNNDKIMMPCGACRELLMQLSNYNKNMKILTNLEKKNTITLEKLMPNWWK